MAGAVCTIDQATCVTSATVDDQVFLVRQHQVVESVFHLFVHRAFDHLLSRLWLHQGLFLEHETLPSLLAAYVATITLPYRGLGRRVVRTCTAHVAIP